MAACTCREGLGPLLTSDARGRAVGRVTCRACRLRARLQRARSPGPLRRGPRVGAARQASPAGVARAAGGGSFASKNNHSRPARPSGTPRGVPLQYRARCPRGRAPRAFFCLYLPYKDQPLMSTVEQQVKAIVAEQLGVKQEQVTDD